MNFWIITSIQLARERALRASGIQNIQTAMALAEAGHQVVVWVKELGADWREIIVQEFQRDLPSSLHFYACKVSGPKGEKKTPFDSALLRLRNVLPALWRYQRPDVILSRSPRAIAQMRRSRLISPRTKLILEYQYPEWAQLWRSWRKRNPQARLREAIRELRRLKANENERLLACDGVLYAAHAHRKLLQKAGFSKPSDILPSACLNAEQKKSEHKDSHDIGYVGGLSPENGVLALLEAMRQLPERSLCIAGAGEAEYVQALKQSAQALQQGQKIEFAGSVPVHQVRALMRSCTVGVVPISRRCGPEKRVYASPLKMMEWAASGTPIVASNVPSVAQTFEPGSEALLVAPDAPDELAQAIELLLNSAADRQRLARSAMYVALKHSYSNRAARIEAFAQRLAR